MLVVLFLSVDIMGQNIIHIVVGVDMEPTDDPILQGQRHSTGPAEEIIRYGHAQVLFVLTLNACVHSQLCC